MKDKTWLMEAAAAACLLAVTIIALALMLGHALWMSLARK
jgi:hypothetical protein